MMKRAAACVILGLMASSACLAQSRLGASVETQYVFDNHEFDASDRSIIPSETIHFYRFSPTIWWRFAEDGNWTHTVYAGLDLVKEAGVKLSSFTDSIVEEPLYFSSHYSNGTRDYVSAFGIYPRRMSEGYYSELIFSEETIEQDFNFDGMFFKYRTGSFYGEIGLDWMGKYGDTRKERFQVFSSGSWKPFGFLSFGWDGSFYHYAGSVEAPGVVDNHVIEPYMLLDGAQWLPLNEANVRIGGFYGYQNDRMRGDLRSPEGYEVEMKLRWRSLMLRNSSSWTDDFLPFYDMTDTGGNAYGDMLYFGSKFYDGFYDRLELAWVPRVSSRLDAKVSFRFHFNGSDGFLGCEQRVSLIYSL